jgi:ATP-dependent Lon protease
MIFSPRSGKDKKQDIPLVPLKNLVVFPHNSVPFFVGRTKTIRAVEEAIKGDRTVFLAPQKSNVDTPGEEDIYKDGTLARIIQMLKLPDGTLRVLVEGMERGTIRKFTSFSPYLRIQAVTRKDLTHVPPESKPIMQTVLEGFKKYARGKKKISQEILDTAERAEYPDKLADIVSAHLDIKMEQKVSLLSGEEPLKRLEELAVIIEAENEVAALQTKIHSKVKKRLEKSQKEYYLNEQIREINKELGKEEEDASGAKEMEARLSKKQLPEEVKAKAEKEVKRLSRLGAMSPEAGVLRTYLEWVVDLPWMEKSQDSKDIDLAEKILDEDHYNMKKPKERVLDFIAVHQLKEKVKGPILCFVGPPGTGKTSLGRSVARAIGREFVRISLGGVKDEAEIRGHRKTYVGALPGKIIQSMRKVGTSNPVFLLDEIDKISSDFRGDPASALLEVLDPEQNSSFMDHYLEVPYDLSGVMFITTANSMYTIPYPLRDRMEIIEIPGYTDFEKVKIAQQFIIPKQIKENGLDWANISFQKQAILTLIHAYTMESGVRNLEREIASIIRKIARQAVKEGYGPGGTMISAEKTPSEEDSSAETPASSKTPFTSVVTAKGVKKYLGNEKFKEDKVIRELRPGLAYGLAWTEMGGTLLPIEAAVLEGPGELMLTGNLGDVMKESAHTALSFLRANYNVFHISPDFQKSGAIHIHVPEGAIPKDGPSAGITLTAALLSALTGITMKSGWAMTGEITLTGRLLKIGGVKEKVLAAYRNKLDHILLPEANREHISELPKEVRSALTFHFSESMREALLLLFPEDSVIRSRSVRSRS